MTSMSSPTRPASPKRLSSLREKGWADGVLAALDVLLAYDGMQSAHYREVRSTCIDDMALRAACKRAGFDALERHGFSTLTGVTTHE